MRAGGVLKGRRQQDLALADAGGDGPHEEIANVAGDDVGQGVECVGSVADEG